MKEFWDERFTKDEFIYGTEPNSFLKSELEQLTAKGNALFALEGEGRNACYASSLGWDVEAFDFSEAGKEKALKLCKSYNTSIDYKISNAEDFEFGENKYDLVVLIYAHLHPSFRTKIHQKIITALRPGGKLILEGFHPLQLKHNYTSGGPKNLEMLYTLDMMKTDFKDLSSIKGAELEIELSEGNYHKGKGFVTRFTGVK